MTSKTYTYGRAQMAPNPYHFAENGEPMIRLEAMIDYAGLGALLDAIEHICASKAAHIAEVWQDTPLARRWDAAASAINGVAARLPGELRGSL